MLFNKKHWNNKKTLKLMFHIGCASVSVILAVCLAACASNRSYPSCIVVSTPNITLTGEKTSIERQIVGDYKELEKDAWIISSVDTNLQKGQGVSVESGDPELLAAMKIRAFHEEKIIDYKDQGVIGEGNDGFVNYLESNTYERDKELKKILQAVMEEENNARRVIFIKSMNKAGIESPKDDEILEFGRMFAGEQRALAKKGHMIQEESGKWVRKK